MKNKIYNSLNSIVPTETQKDYMFQNITRPRNKVGGYMFKICLMATCFIITFTLFSNQIGVENNNQKPRIVEYNCEECEDSSIEERN